MKRNMLGVFVRTLVLAMFVLVSGEVCGQKVKSWPTASETLARILGDTDKIPLILYPPRYLEWLASEGDNILGFDSMQSSMPSPPGGGEGGGGSSPPPCSQAGCDSSFPEYVLVDLGTLGGLNSTAYGINEHGQVVGYADSGNGVHHAYIYSGGVMQDLYTSVLSTSEGADINESGRVTGSYNSYANAFQYLSGSSLDIGSLGGTSTQAYGINDAGHIVGLSRLPSSSDHHAFLYNNGTMQDLGTLGGSRSTAYGINNYGQIVGVSDMVGDTSYHAFLHYDGLLQDLGSMGGDNSHASAINNCGQIVGFVFNGPASTHAFLYSNGSVQLIGDLGGNHSVALDINSCGHIVGRSNGRPFLYKNGTMRDLNDLVIAPTGMTLNTATAINNKGQIVGYGLNPLGQARAFRLDPLNGFDQIATNQLPQPVYTNCPARGAGKSNLVVVTHGWYSTFWNSAIINPPDLTWLRDMSNVISGYITSHSLTNWQVYGYEWLQGAWRFHSDDALSNAKQVGKYVGDCIGSQGWTHVHLIAHSAGAGLIHAATERIKALSPTTTVHCTFLDAFVGSDYAGVSRYGNGADWSDSYFSRDATTRFNNFTSQGPLTEGPLAYAYNLDVTTLDPHKLPQVGKFRSSSAGLAEPCYETITSHSWPINFYTNTITGNTNSYYAGFGFPLSKEGGNWNYALSHYTPSNSPAQILGVADPSCTSVQSPPQLYSSVTPKFGEWPFTNSVTGKFFQRTNGSIEMTNSSPVWLATVVTSTNPVNMVSFNAKFTSASGAQGLLSVYWDENVIGTLDERVVQSGFQHYELRFPNATAGSSHILGFRLDPFTNINSSITLTNVVLSQVGVSQPFLLSTTTNSTNGVRIYQLTGESGFKYHVQETTNLVDWTDIATLLNTNGTVQFYDQSATNYTRRFYRAVAPY